MHKNIITYQGLRPRKYNRLRKRNTIKAFTLLEVLIVIGIIAVLSALTLVAINPNRQFKLARDAQRLSNVSAIVSAVSQNISENRGVFMCGDSIMSLPSTSTPLQSSGGFDIAPCIVPNYIPSMPFDPNLQGAHYSSTTNYITGYDIYRDNEGRIVASSTGEITPHITAIR